MTYGLAAIGLRTANSYASEFEATLPPKRISVDDFASRLSTFFMDQWKAAMPPDYQGPPMTFVVGGFNEKQAYGRVFLFDIPSAPLPAIRGAEGEFGITWGGQRNQVDRLLQGFDAELPNALIAELQLTPDQQAKMPQVLGRFQMPAPIQAMALQDCVDLAIFFVRTTIAAQALTVGIRGCGGPIDVATITRDGGMSFVQQKQLRGEQGTLAMVR